MTLFEKIIEIYPELTPNVEKDEFYNGLIELRDDGDGIVYIAKWQYSKPIPEGLKLGK